MTEIEQLAWDVTRARRRTDVERAQVARYIVDLIEPTLGTRLLVAVEPDDDPDVMWGPALVPVRDEFNRVWAGVLLGNVAGAGVGGGDEMVYSIVLFAFLGGRRQDRRLLRSFSARLGSSGPEVWASGSVDEYGEWESIESPLDPADFTLTPELATAARELRLLGDAD